MVQRFSFLIPLAALVLLAGLAIACQAKRPHNNLALRHPAYHSSAIDYNATAQLAVDGILETEPGCWVEVCGKDGVPLSKREHDLVLEPRQWTTVTKEGPSAELSLRTHGFTEPVDRVTMSLAAHLPDGMREAAYTAELARLDKDGTWVPVQRFEGRYLGRRLTLTWDAPERVAPEGWRFVVEMPGAKAIEWQEWGFFRDGQLLPMLTSEHFSSAWVSATGGREWIAVDLGAEKRFNQVQLHWLNAPAQGVIQVSSDSTTWRDIASLKGTEPVRCDKLRVRGRGRWVRLMLDGSVDNKPYVLSELQVFGSSSAEDKTRLASARPTVRDCRIDLDCGWQLARLPQAEDPAAWIPATVPGTVLISYLENGMLPDPNFGENFQYISDSYFLSPFVYRTQFRVPEGWRSGEADERIRLHFDGINWKADVVFNGQAVGRIEGAFTDASFDITPLLEADNLLEVTVYPPDHPGMTKENTQTHCATNGGILGADNPTFHASIGWDWIQTIRGRETGIWNDVWLDRTGGVRIVDPTVRFGFNMLEKMPPKIDTTRVRITLGATLVNDTDHPVETVWEGSYGDVRFHQAVTVPASSSLPVSTKVELMHPKLWWPNGYGEPHLYPVSMRVGESDTHTFFSGVRQLTYSTAGGNLRIWINGRRLVGRGGNWGFSESNLKFKAADYERTMWLHQKENFNLIRNWVGQVGDEELYEMADRYGILIWQDFWLANPADGPDPDNEALFMDNAENMMRRIRNHPCLLLWCGRNEGYPPASLDNALRELVNREDPGSFYLSSSADDIVSGRGTYYRLPSKAYWQLDQIPWFRNESVMFHSERGMPNFPNWESLIRMMPAADAWPPSRLWGVHDFALESAQRGQTFIDAVNSFFGPSPDGETFAARAQWVNYEGYRSIFESRSRNRRGLLLWMSHPAWPSMAFCTYDWFGDATASYYACRKACEPLHIQWNPVGERVEVVNYSAGDRTGLRAVATLYDLSGTVVSTQVRTLDAREDSTTPLFGIDFSKAGFSGDKTGSDKVGSDRAGGDTAGGDGGDRICFLRLELFDGEQLISHNDYVIPQQEDNLQVLNRLPQVKIETSFSWDPDRNQFVAKLSNPSDKPALMLHLSARDADGNRILPTIWSDNYIHLMPGEERTLTLSMPDKETYPYSLRLTGFNTAPLTIEETMHRQVVE